MGAPIKLQSMKKKYGAKKIESNLTLVCINIYFFGHKKISSIRMNVRSYAYSVWRPALLRIVNLLVCTSKRASCFQFCVLHKVVFQLLFFFLAKNVPRAVFVDVCVPAYVYVCVCVCVAVCVFVYDISKA